MKNPLVQKSLAICALTLLILIALFRVSGVIGDRQKYRENAIRSIEASYAGQQVLIGPVLIRPYVEMIDVAGVNDKGMPKLTKRKQEMTAVIFPHELDVYGAVQPSERRHGLFKVPVYEFQGRLKGRFQAEEPQVQGSVIWGEPYLALSVADVRGVIGTPKVIVSGISETMLQGAPLATGWQPNLRIPLNGLAPIKGSLDFDLSIDLAGTEMVSIAPIGDSNHFELSSMWRSPLFSGQFLPRTQSIQAGGFQAVWDVSSLASGAQGQVQESPFKGADLVKVSLATRLDPYTLSDRAVKYGILFVVLTFGGFFLFELIEQLRIHPVQYLLVGFGLAIFFLLLVSFSEHMAFGSAYLIASTACIGLLTFYLSFVLLSLKRGLTFGGTLILLYSALYGLLISEDNALVLGSLMLFFLLAGVMFITRKVDWYKSTAGLVDGREDSAQSPSPTRMQ